MKLSIFALVVIAFAASAFAANITSCGVISSPGTYKLAGNIFANTSSNCITVNAHRVDIDCAGYIITNANPLSGTGVYSDKSSTAIRNCKVMNFSKGIYFNGASTGSIRNTTVRAENGTSDSVGILLANSAKYNTIKDTTSYAYRGQGGIVISSGSNYNTITNTEASTVLGVAGLSLKNCNNNTVNASKGINVNGRGIQIESASNSLVVDSEGKADIMEGVRIISISSNNTILRSRGISGSTSGIAIEAFFGQMNNKIIDSNGSSNYGKGIYISSSDGNLLNGAIGSSNFSYGIYLRKADSNSVIKSTGASKKGVGIYIDYGSDHNAISKCIAKNNEWYSALKISNATFNTIEGCEIDGVNGQDALNVGGYSFNNTIANSSIKNGANGYAVNFQTALGPASGNRMINNTINGTGGLLKLGANAGSNAFCWNSFAATSGIYINDTNGSNAYNSPLCGGEGNIYANVLSGAVKVQGNRSSSGFPQLFVGMNGTGYPYSAATSYGRVIGSAIDFAPLTPFYFNNSSAVEDCPCGTNITTPNYSCVINSNRNSTGTCLTVQAENVKIECNPDKSIQYIGSPSATSYGIITTMPGTQIHGCTFNDFTIGVYFKGADNGLMNLTRTKAKSHGILLENGSDGNVLYGSVGESTVGGDGIKISDSAQNSIFNCVGVGYDPIGGINLQNADGTVVANSSGYSELGGAGIYMLNCENSTVKDSILNSGLAEGIIVSHSNGNAIYGNQIHSEQSGGMLMVASSDNTVSRNMFGSFYGDELSINGDSGSNLFYWNYFDGTMMKYVVDAGSGNMFNTTIDGKGEGNLYQKVVWYGAPEIYGTELSAYGDGLYIGTGGAGYPYSEATAPDKMAGNAVDYAPLTPYYFNNSSMPPETCACGIALTVPNYFCNVTSDLTTNSTCFDVKADNVTIGCNGHSITNAAGFAEGNYGIYSERFGTVVSGCNISGFARGIYFNGADSGRVIGTEAIAANHAILLENGANFNIISGSAGRAEYGYGGDGIKIANSIQNTITDSNGYSYDSVGGINLQGAYGTIVNNSEGVSELGGAGIYIGYGGNNTVANSVASSGLADGMVISRSSGNIVYGSGIVSVAYNAMRLAIASGNRIYANTLVSPSGSLLSISTGSDSNLFYWNNFTNPSLKYIIDSGSGNLFNTTINGLPEGNIYTNVLNGSVQVQGSEPSSYGQGLYIGESGEGYPYSAATSQGKVVGSAVDYAPLTPYYSSGNKSQAGAGVPEAENAPSGASAE